MFCNACGQENADGSLFCARCGAPLAPAARPADAARSQSPGPGAAVHDPYALSPSIARMETVPTAGDDLMKAFIGPKNQHYYLERFEALEAQGGRLRAGWHWSAFFLTWYWMLYRKMWLAALIYFLLPAILGAVFGLLASVTGFNSLPAFSGITYLVVTFVLAPMYATSLYYKKYVAVLSQGDPGASRERTLARLEAKGGTSGIILIVLGALVVAMLIGVLAAIAIPAYSDYTRRARSVGVTDSGIPAPSPVRAGVG